MFPFTETLQTFEKFPRIEAQVAPAGMRRPVSLPSRYNSSTKCILASMPCWVTHGGHGGIPRQLNYAGQASRISNTLRGSSAPDNRPFSWTSGICIGPLVCAQDKGEPWNLCCKNIIQHSMSLINVTSPGEHLLNSKILDQDVH